MTEPETLVYLMTGFLDSGKTQFLKFTLQQDYFQIDGKTLLILCEEGEEEYPAGEMLKYGVVIEHVEEQELSLIHIFGKISEIESGQFGNGSGDDLYDGISAEHICRKYLFRALQPGHRSMGGGQCKGTEKNVYASSGRSLEVK